MFPSLSALLKLTLTLFVTVLAVAAKPAVMVINPGYRLVVDADKGAIKLFRATQGEDRELLIPHHGQLPLFKIQFRTDDAKFETVTSASAKKVSVTRTAEAGVEILVLTYECIGNAEVDARVTGPVRSSPKRAPGPISVRLPAGRPESAR